MSRIKSIAILPAQFVGIVLTLMGAGPIAAGTIEVGNVSEFRNALGGAVTGDEIVLRPGRYAGRFEVIGKRGLTIRSLDPANPAVIDATGVGEGLKMSRVAEIVLKDFAIERASENGINIDDVAGGITEASRDITIERVHVRNGTGHGIKLTGVDNFLIDQVHVVGWGRDDVAVNLIGAHHGIVQRSYFENPSPGSGVGVQAKGGAVDVVIRANRFVNANERSIQFGGQTGLNQFRPQPPGTVEAEDIIAEGNVILNNGNQRQGIRSAVSFVNVEDGVFRNNVVFRPSLFVSRILKENREAGFINTRGGELSDNVIVWNQGDIADAINVGSSTEPQTFTFSGNQWYNATRPQSSQPSLPVPEVGGVYGIDPQLDLRGITPWDFPWGKWLVNTSDLLDTVTIANHEQYYVAIPSAGADFDLGAEHPLTGQWRFEPLGSADVSVNPFDFKLLVTNVPEPTAQSVMWIALGSLLSTRLGRTSRLRCIQSRHHY